MGQGVFWVGWRCSSGHAQRCRREQRTQSISDALRFHWLRPSRGRQADAACAQQVRQSAAFACIVVVMAIIPNTSPPGCLCACLLRRRSFGVCAARLNSNSISLALSLCTRRLGSKWRTSATEEPRTRCENCYPDTCSLFRFLPRLVHQRALEICIILDCSYSSNRQQPRR